ncbi:adenosylcobinamide-GDP ribazoletransferase [Roseibacterium sp. SDUM158017]|uniref:adenosylcobinamide-GDP ribazoletransferase n=1 Tax=Roseicyclus salinarum TaxID=3036773 RepID=UPI0024152CFA|nr:adenosylcobinamide-GDP ribazoletransferase [Roseibacterium sp. SDUM158017]MDG4649960.1 adenosylcobinamide-GDP ribazoletransferase [Roseibacterium sp. SDUM158017]
MNPKTSEDHGQDAPFLHQGDFGAALMLLTRIPCPAWLAADRGARSAWAWPLVGALVALVSWGAGAASVALGLPPAIAAGAAIAVALILTGALHEDGLADCADGFWGASRRERRLEILRDSRVGSYGVVALVMVLGMRWTAIATLFEGGAALAGMLAAAVLSRAAMAGVMAALPFARPDGLAVLSGRPAAGTVALGAVLSLAGVAAASGGVSALVAALAALAAALGCAAVARAKIGGQTGDVLGATQQVSELAILLTCVALLP